MKYKISNHHFKKTVGPQILIDPKKSINKIRALVLLPSSRFSGGVRPFREIYRLR